MGISVFVVTGEGTAEVLPKKGEHLQTKVSCQNDIEVFPFYPEDCDGVAWMLLCEGSESEPGQDSPGVLIGAKDPRSLDSIIRVATMLRDRLRSIRRRPMMDIMDDEDQRCLRDLDEAIRVNKQKASLSAIDEKIALGMARQTARDVDRRIEDALRPGEPLGDAMGNAISARLDRAMVDALYEDDEPGEDEDE